MRTERGPRALVLLAGLSFAMVVTLATERTAHSQTPAAGDVIVGDIGTRAVYHVDPVDGI